MANYPTTLPNFGSNVAAGDIILAGHINDIRAELIAIAKTLSAADSGTIDPANVIDTLLTAGYAAAINVAGINRVGGVLDVLASQLKQVLGDGWQTTPVINLIQLKAPNYLVGSTQANLPNSITLANVHRSGLLSARPAANTLPAGVFYFATDTGQMFRTDGSTWTTISSTPVAGLANGDLIYWDGTKFVTIVAPVTTQPTYLQRSGNNYSFVTAAVGYNILESPSIYNRLTNIYQPFATIQQAIDAVTLPVDEIVLIPPGTYNEAITIHAGIIVQEVMYGTVTLLYSGLDALPTVDAMEGCTINVFKIIRENGTGPALQMQGYNPISNNSNIKFIRSSTCTGDATCINIVNWTGASFTPTYIMGVHFEIYSDDNVAGIKSAVRVANNKNAIIFDRCVFTVIGGYGTTRTNQTINVIHISGYMTCVFFNPTFDFAAIVDKQPGTMRILYNVGSYSNVFTLPMILGAVKSFADYCSGLYTLDGSGAPLGIVDASTVRGTNVTIIDVQALTGLVLAQQTFI